MSITYTEAEQIVMQEARHWLGDIKERGATIEDIDDDDLEWLASAIVFRFWGEEIVADGPGKVIHHHDTRRRLKGDPHAGD